ncbi:ecdysoneless-like protein [Oryzias melastigma]|uniref:Ecdysoneless-like protein n=1 Tax=Oryzias melastigma TaxID=30732 RepID=A0A834FLL8_ORYME|nr:ecdysoneless-like protein [Oryzias melastigma]
MDPLQQRVLQDDMVQYKIFLLPTTPQQNEQQLKQLLGDILAKFAPLLVDYIWQNQPFNLQYRPSKGDIPAHLGGITQFGDNVEDEWFIVYLLQQITKTFPELVVRVEDNDGEFILIEVADYLPKWLSPDTSENRVFLFKGELHIIPRPSKSSSVGFPRNVVPSVEQALTLLSDHSEACQASPEIRSALRKRLEGFPEKIKSGLHRAHCFIPAGIATVLTHRPDLVAPAVSAFYFRDPVDLQACRSFKTFHPDSRVLTLVMFTRCLYAQLQQQQFTPDRRSGFNLPPRSHPHYKAHELGMKLAHGFEILCSRCRLPSAEPDAAVSCNPQWKSFMKSLQKNDYFRGELEGSARYKELLRSAEIFFKQSVASKSSVLSPGEEVLQVLHSCGPINVEELKKLESQLPLEDSDSWLDITAQGLEQLLQERSGGRMDVGGAFSSIKRPENSSDAAEENTEVKGIEEEDDSTYSLVAVSQGIKDFFNSMSSHEGAELPWSRPSQPFRFDPDSMVSALDQLLGNKDKELDSDDLEDDDDEDVDHDEEEENEESSSDHAEMSGPETLNSIKKYMDQMDEELMSTNVGQSFSQTKLSEPSSENAAPHSPEGGASEEDFQPLNLDVNLMANLLESLSCQAGLAGPASNLLQSLGVHLPANSDPS